MSDNLQPMQVPESQKIVKINEAALDKHLDRKITEAVETTLNQLLDEEADHLAGTERYARD